MLRSFLLSSIALVIAGSAQAQDVVVTGKRAQSNGQVAREVRQIMTTVADQLARFAEPVCPMLSGLSPESAVYFTNRFRELAAAAGVKTAPMPCKPNIVVIVAGDADDYTAALGKRFPYLFAGVRPGELRRARRDGPVHAWNTVEARNDIGIAASGSDGSDAPMLAINTVSRVTFPTSQVTVQAIVVLDAEAVVGKSLDQIAAFAAMRTLAGARPPADGASVDSVMTLFNPEAPQPPDLTPLDRSFLRQLYAGPGNNHINRTIGKITQEVRAGQGAARPAARP